MKNYIDLHSHSSMSLDGEKDPEKLVDLAIESGIRYYAIADHDDTRGLSRAFNYAKDKNITLIPAIEISAIIDQHPLHILGYNIDYTNPFYEQRRKQVDDCLIPFNQQIIEKTLNYGFKFDVDKLLNLRPDHLICEEMIGQVILEDPRNDDRQDLLPFRKGGSLSDNPTFNFYKVFCTKDKPLYCPYNFNLPIEDTARIIKESGGKMFLAHPAHNIKFNEDILQKIISYGLDGLEVFSSYHNQKETEYYYEMAKKYNLHMSVGSDYHGRSKPAIKLGSIDYDEQELIQTLKFLGVYNG